MLNKLKIIAPMIFVAILSPAQLYAQNVKITPLGSHDGELCSADRALLFEDPTGVRILYDAGATVAGGSDPRLGDVHAILLSHAHSDHIGANKLGDLNAGSCGQPKTVSAAPNSNTAEIAAAKNSALVVSLDMGAFLGKKIQNINGTQTMPCPTTGLARETVLPRPLPCLAILQLGGNRIVKMTGQASGVQIASVQANHTNTAPRSLLTDPEKTNLAADDLTAYVGPANGYVLRFTNGLRVYLSGDTSIMGDMKTIIAAYYKVNLAVMNVKAETQETAFAVNELIQPNAVIASHVNEAATSSGKVKPESQTREFIELVKGRPVHLPLSGKTMEFDGNAKCTAGC
jgi:L-ascorbate metabolism protein UlaG (beta-lactamase superfamily)